MAPRSRAMAALAVGMVGALVAAGSVASRPAGAQTAHYVRARAARATAEPPAEPVITLERTACRGQCAEYKLSFFEDGQIVYDGRANSSKAGRWYAHVPRETVNQLAGEFRRIGYDSLATKYPPGLSDSPIASTSLRAGVRIKTVTHEEGSPFPPPALSVLEDRLDAAVQSVEWVR